VILIGEVINRTNVIKPTVSSFAKKNIPFLLREEKALRAREIMRESFLRVLPVVESNSFRKVIGVVHRIDLLNISSTRSNLTVNDIMSRDFLSFDESYDVIEALEAMLNNGEWYSIVEKKNGELEGIFGLESGIAYLSSSRKEALSAPIEGIYIRDPLAVYEDDEISKVWYLMLKHKYAGFPVISRKNLLVGVITQHDLLRKGYSRPVLESSSPRKIEVKDVMTTPPIAVEPNSSIGEIVEIMLKKDIGRVYVAESRKLTGVVDREDVVRFLLKKY